MTPSRSAEFRLLFAIRRDGEVGCGCMAEPIKQATVAVIAGLIAAVKLARVDSSEINRRSSRVRCAISDSVDIAQMVLAEAMRRQ